MILIKLPDGISYSEYKAANDQRAATGETPEWWSERVLMGGPGALAPGVTGETTMNLEPGEYAMVCPGQTHDGISHSTLGMMRPLTVTEETSDAPEPEADITLTLRGKAFDMDGVITQGEHTIRVRFEDKPDGRTHDVHVARLGPNQSVEDFAKSMETLDLTNSDFYFIGGAEDMPEDYTAYFTANFEPGRYALWCHLHSGDGMVEEFSVE